MGEPSVPDTINILRGLKERYEGHHGVRISDRALVVAAELSDRRAALAAGPPGRRATWPLGCTCRARCACWPRAHAAAATGTTSSFPPTRPAHHLTHPAPLTPSHPPAGTSSRASCPTRPSTWWTRRAPTCACSWTPSPRTSTAWSGSASGCRWAAAALVAAGCCLLVGDRGGGLPAPPGPSLPFLTPRLPLPPPRLPQVEEKALSKEKDPLSRERLAAVQKELGALDDALRPLQMRYQQEKGRLDEIRRLQVRWRWRWWWCWWCCWCCCW